MTIIDGCSKVALEGSEGREFDIPVIDRLKKCIHSGSVTNKTAARIYTFTDPGCCAAWVKCGNDGVKPVSGLFIENRQTSCYMLCPIYEALY